MAGSRKYDLVNNKRVAQPAVFNHYTSKNPSYVSDEFSFSFTNFFCTYLKTFIAAIALVIVAAVVGVLFALGVFSGSSTSSSAAAPSNPTGGAPVYLPTGSLVAGTVYQISPGASPSLCIQSNPGANSTQPTDTSGTPAFTTLSTQLCSSDPSQYWLYTAGGALSLNYIDVGFVHSYMAGQGGCSANQPVVGYPETSRSPSSAESVTYTNGQLQFCGQYCLGTNLQLTTSCPTNGWTLTAVTNPPGGALMVGQLTSFEYYPQINLAGGDTCNMYQEVVEGFAMSYGGVIQAPCSNWSPYGGATNAYDGVQYAYIEAGSPGCNNIYCWMNATVNGFSPGHTYSVSFAYSTRSNNAYTNSHLAVYLGGAALILPSAVSQTGWTSISPTTLPSNQLVLNNVVVSTSSATLAFAVIVPSAQAGDRTLFFDAITVVLVS